MSKTRIDDILAIITGIIPTVRGSILYTAKKDSQIESAAIHGGHPEPSTVNHKSHLKCTACTQICTVREPSP